MRLVCIYFHKSTCKNTIPQRTSYDSKRKLERAQFMSDFKLKNVPF